VPFYLFCLFCIYIALFTFYIPAIFCPSHFFLSFLFKTIFFPITDHFVQNLSHREGMEDSSLLGLLDTDLAYLCKDRFEIVWAGVVRVQHQPRAGTCNVVISARLKNRCVYGKLGTQFLKVEKSSWGKKSWDPLGPVTVLYIRPNPAYYRVLRQ
jgi:hypothetical protein